MYNPCTPILDSLFNPTRTQLTEEVTHGAGQRLQPLPQQTLHHSLSLIPTGKPRKVLEIQNKMTVREINIDQYYLRNICAATELSNLQTYWYLSRDWVVGDQKRRSPKYLQDVVTGLFSGISQKISTQQRMSGWYLKVIGQIASIWHERFNPALFIDSDLKYTATKKWNSQLFAHTHTHTITAA